MLVAKNSEVERRKVDVLEGLPIRGSLFMKPLMFGERMMMLEIHYPAGSASPVHTHQHESVCYIIKGKARAMVDGETYVLEAGDACRHPDGVPHAIEALEDTTLLEIKSPSQPLEEFLGMAGN